MPYFIYIFDELGRIGLGKGRDKYALERVLNDEVISYESGSKTLKNNSFKEAYINYIAKTLGDGVETVKIRFLTPTRIKYNRETLLLSANFIFILSLCIV